MTRDQIIAAIRAQEAVLRAEGVTHLALFGSRSRGDGGPDSDLDVVIETDPGKRFSLLNLSGVGLHIEDVLGIPCQIVMRRSLPPSFARRIEDDLVEVF